MNKIITAIVILAAIAIGWFILNLETPLTT